MLNLEVIGMGTQHIDRMTESQMQREQMEALRMEEQEQDDEDSL